MIFPYDSNSRFSDPKAARPTQRPASNSNARKRAGEPCFSPSDATFERELAGLDPHTDNGFAEVIRKAKAEAYDEGWNAAVLRRPNREPRNPYEDAS